MVENPKTYEINTKIINKKTLIGELVKYYPDSVSILQDSGIECVGCCVATWETIEQAAASNKLDVENLIQALNNNLGGRNA
jgi:hybrid cluster-associated redox disulfide protein